MFCTETGEDMNEEREIDLKLLFANVFKKWRKILLITLILGLLCAGYRAVKLLPSYSSLQSAYTSEVTSYNSSKALLDQQIAHTNDLIAQLGTYSTESIKANIDPYNEVQTTATISIVATTDEAQRSNQITEAYQNFVDAGIKYESVAGSLKTTDQIIKELVSAKSDFDSDTVTITVVGQTADQTEPVMKYVLSQVNGTTSNVAEKYGKHTLIVSDSATHTVADADLLSTTFQTTDQMLSSNKVMNGVLNKTNSLKSALKTLKATSIATPVSPKKTIAKGVIKYGLFGLVLGFFGSIVVMAVAIVASKKLSSENELKNIFKVKVLSVMPMKNLSSKTRLDQFINKKIDSSYQVDEQVALEKASVNLLACADNKKSLILVGENIQQDIDELKTKIQAFDKDIKFVASANINSSASELKKLKDSDGIILVAERNVTKLDDLTKTIETINNWNKPIVGSIVL